MCLIELIQKGGMVHYTSQLSNALSIKEGFKVYVIAPEGINTDIFDSGVNILKIPVFGRHPFRIDLLLKYILTINPDIVHITIRHPLIFTVFPFLSIKKIPVVLTVHDILPHPGEKFLYLSNISSYISMRYCKKIFVHGNKLKSELISQKVPENKIKVIPHGDYSFFSKNKEVIPEEENTILFFGRIMEYKGLEYLIQAEPLISKNISNFKIIIAGEGDFSKYSSMIKNESSFRIINEYISEDEVATLFQSSSLVVLPYTEASQSGIVPIAYTFKKPVIATNVGSLNEVVFDGVTGYIVPPRDTYSLADSISKLLKNKSLRYDMGNKGYKFASEELSWDSIAKNTIETYKEIV